MFKTIFLIVQHNKVQYLQLHTSISVRAVPKICKRVFPLHNFATGESTPTGLTHESESSLLKMTDDDILRLLLIMIISILTIAMMMRFEVML